MVFQTGQGSDSRFDRLVQSSFHYNGYKLVHYSIPDPLSAINYLLSATFYQTSLSLSITVFSIENSQVLFFI